MKKLFSSIEFFKKAIFLVLLSMSINSLLNAQNDSATKAQLLNVALEEIRIEKDDFSEMILYFSSRTPKDKSGDDRFLLYVQQEGKLSKKRLFLSVSRFETSRYEVLRNTIKSIYIVADGQNITLPISLGEIVGVQTLRCVFRLGFGMKKEIFEFVKRMVDADDVRIRVVTTFGKEHVFKVSNREKKAINDVLTYWYALPDEVKFTF